MDISALSPLDGRYHGKVLQLREICSEFALIKYRLRTEIHWFMFACNTLVQIDSADIQWLESLADSISMHDGKEIKKREQITNHDVKAVEYWLREAIARKASLKKHSELVHFGCTSEDINNVAYARMCVDARGYMLGLLNDIIGKLAAFSHAHAKLPMLARTHGQPASPTTLGKEMGNFVYRLKRQYALLENQSVTAKWNGAVGNYNAHAFACPDIDWIALSRQFIESLGLEWNPMTTQIEPHDNLAELLHTVIRCNTILIDMCRDIWGYISIGYFRQKSKDGEIGSSTMPHKVNPIEFENAEGNLGVANALLEHLAHKLPVSRWQRDLSDSTVLRNLGSGFGYCAVAYKSIGQGLNKLHVNNDALAEDLHNADEVLAEAIQTVMRYHGIANSYEQVKALTRGKKADKTTLLKFINTLAIPQQSKQRLQKLTPDSYIGLAEKLVQQFIDKH